MYMSYVKAMNAQELMPAKKGPFELLVEYLSFFSGVVIVKLPVMQHMNPHPF